MSVFSDEDVQKIAHLARLSIPSQRIAAYSESMANTLTLISELEKINTDGIEPMAHPIEAHQRLREDRITEHNQRDNFQGIAPQTAEGLYLVPKVIE